ncbi:hypothetical protein FV218_02225 [Methylobacterium sp. WL69]|nr:hypothetical protein FV218_02225 [Methylobacterium sp. WL69]
MNPATVACSALLALSVLAFAPGSMAQTAPSSAPQTRPTPAATPPAAPGARQANSPQPGQTQATPPSAQRPASPAQPTPAQAAPTPGGRGAGAARRPRSSYASCNRLAHARGLRGGARRRFLIRCKLGYERPRPPQAAPARQP